MNGPTVYMFNQCHLLKQVGEHVAGTKVNIVHFDVLGMVLFFKVDNNEYGPYVLTTEKADRIPDTPVTSD